MKKVPLWFPFLIALFFTLFGTVFFPKIHIIPFAPFLAILFNRCTFPKSLWIACACGLVIDLLCSQAHFGLFALNYCLLTIALYKQRRNFFEDKTISLCLFTALISSFSTLIQLFLSASFDQGLPLSWQFIATSILLMPCVDALYAFLGFSLMMKLYQSIQKLDLRPLVKRLMEALRHFSKNVAKSE